MASMLTPPIAERKSFKLFAGTGQVICRDRGRPARKWARSAKMYWDLLLKNAGLRRVCGRDARGPSKSLDSQKLTL